MKKVRWKFAITDGDHLRTFVVIPTNDYREAKQVAEEVQRRDYQSCRLHYLSIKW